MLVPFPYAWTITFYTIDVEASTQHGNLPQVLERKKKPWNHLVQFLWIHYTLIDSFLLHCVPLSMESISIFSPSSIGGLPLSGRKFSVHSKGNTPTQNQQKPWGYFTLVTLRHTQVSVIPNVFCGAYSLTTPPKIKQGTIFRHIFHTEHPNMSAFGLFVDLLVSTPWRKCREVTDLGPR